MDKEYNEKSIDIIQELDVVLFFFKSIYPKSTSISTVYQELGSKLNLKYSELVCEGIINSSIEYLVKDEKIKRFEPFKDNEGHIIAECDRVTKFVLSFEGLLFLQTIGSYKQKQIIDSSENMRLENIEMHQMRHQSYMTWLTVIVSLGVLFQCGYYALDIHKNHPRFWDSSTRLLITGIPAIAALIAIILLLTVHLGFTIKNRKL